LHDYLRADKNIYTSEVGKLLLLAAIKRAYEPGCKYDYMVVLEGEEGIGKGTVISILGGEYYGDVVLNVHSPDTVDVMRKKWFIEVSEMEVSRRADVQALKSFLTRNVDTVRLAYARCSQDFPRKCVFIGTFNPEPESSYVKNVSGNRRYLPVLLHGDTFLDFEKLKNDRDQLFAEAVHHYTLNKNIPLYITDKVAFNEAKKVVRGREVDDPWTEHIVEWLNDCDGQGTKKEFTTSKEIYTHALHGSASSFNQQMSRRISTIMARQLGWDRGPKRVDGILKKGFLKPERG
jgi:predicted P-loop ATPase